MKKLLAVGCIAVGLTICAQDFRNSFYELIGNEKFEQADSLLGEWAKSTPSDPEIFPARFNYHLNRAHQSYLYISGDTMPDGEALFLSDSTGTPAGSIQETTRWNDSLVYLGIEAIDKGIEMFPDRLDFRFGKASALIFIENWPELIKTSAAILERGKANDCKWQFTDGEQYDTERGTEIMLEGIHSYESALAENDDAGTLIDMNLSYYPKDHVALTLKGAIAYEAGDKAKAIEYTEQALGAAPDDPLISCNLAYMLLERGDEKRALALYKSIVDNEKADKEWQEIARQAIAEINADLKDIRLYDFEFRFLPAFAAGVKPDRAGTTELLSDIGYICGKRLARAGYKFPFDYSDIKADVIGEGDSAIVVWTLPDPPEIPLAKYIAFVPDTETNTYKVYTLEKSIDWGGSEETVWILGIAQPSGHSNLGQIGYPATPAEFADIITRILAARANARSSEE